MENVLRVGICACTDSYHGEFSDQIWVIDTLDEKKVSQIILQIKEVCIPETHQQAALTSSRCHFFVDKHYQHFLKNPSSLQKDQRYSMLF